MCSMQSRLTLSLTLAAMLFSAIAGYVLHHTLGAILIRQFDRTLEDKARGLSLLVSRELNGRLEFEFAPKAMPEYQRTEHAEYFQVQFDDGQVYVESQSLNGKLLPQFPPDGTAHDLILPTGRMGRVICQNFTPRPEDEIEPLPRPLSEIPHIEAGKQMIITMARDRAELDGALRELTECVVFSALGLALVTAAAATWIVHRALLPLRVVAQQADQIDTTRLDHRFPDSGLPSELLPICLRLNDLLSRIEEAFIRERRFTADVAHELRTPIAELRSVTEVAMKWPDDIASTRQAVVDSHAIARQMEMLVTTLLSLVRTNRLQAGTVQGRPISLTHELRRVAELLESSSSQPAIRVDSIADAFVLADPVLLGSVLTNLLSNALEYKAAGSNVICRVSAVEDQWVLAIENKTANVTSEDVKHLFEPFWRKDRSRTGTSHTGLGLSLVRGFCDLMGVKITASISNFLLQMTLSFPAASEAKPGSEAVHLLAEQPENMQTSAQ